MHGLKNSSPDLSETLYPAKTLISALNLRALNPVEATRTFDPQKCRSDLQNYKIVRVVSSC